MDVPTLERTALLQEGITTTKRSELDMSEHQ